MEGEQQVHIYDGELRVLNQQNDFEYNVELSLLDDRTTANGWRYENLAEHRPLFAKKPILIAYTRGGAKIGDGHNMKVGRDKEGNEYASFTDADSERIIGSLSDNEEDITLVERDGHTWIVGKGTIWKWYAREAVEKIAMQGRMDISIETLVTKNRMEGDEEVEETFIPLGATILGDDVPPAVKGAHIRPLSTRNEVEFRELMVRAASYREKKEEQPEKKTSKGVKRYMNRKQIEKLQPLFKDHRVLSVSEDGNTAILMNADGEFCAYSFPEQDREQILDSRFQQVNASIEVVLNEDTTEHLDIYDFLSRNDSELANAKSALETERGLREQAEKDLKDALAREKKQRMAAAKAAVQRELAEINEQLVSAEKVDNSIIAPVVAAIEGGEYDDCMNADGEWNGDERACAAVKALCMDAFKESRKRRAGVDAWNVVNNGSSNGDPMIDSLNSLK